VTFQLWQPVAKLVQQALDDMMSEEIRSILAINEHMKETFCMQFTGVQEGIGF